MVSSFVFYEVSVCMSESACSIYVSYAFPWGLLIYVLSNSALFYFILSYFRCLFHNDRARKGLDLREWEGGEDLGGASGRETGIRIYCLKKQSIFNFFKKMKNY